MSVEEPDMAEALAIGLRIMRLTANAKLDGNHERVSVSVDSSPGNQIVQSFVGA
jgi:hypothetical protein